MWSEESQFNSRQDFNVSKICFLSGLSLDRGEKGGVTDMRSASGFPCCSMSISTEKEGGGADVQDARGQVFDIQYRKSNERKKNRYIQEATDKAITSYRENPLHYDEGAQYYQVLRRQLGCFGENIFTDNPVLDNNLRTEHQHFWGDNGDNFGFMGDGKDILEGEGKVREDTGYSLDDYRDDIPGLGAKKFKGVYIRMAHDILQNNFGNYNFILNNCQDYVDEVIHIANILAEKNNDMLEIT